MTYSRPHMAWPVARIGAEGEELLGRDGTFGATGMAIAMFPTREAADEAAEPHDGFTYAVATENLPGMAYLIGLEQALAANPEGPLAAAIQAELDAAAA